jgi:WD40 repeat protein
MESTTGFARVTLLAATLLFAGCLGPLTRADDAPEVGALAPVALCAAGEGTLSELWSVDNGHGALHAMALAPMGSVALAGDDGSIKVWRVDPDGAALAATALAPGGLSVTYGQQFGSGAVVRALAIDADGATVVGGDDSGLVALLDAADGTVLGSTVPGFDPVTAVAQSDDGALVASADASFAGNLRVWEPGGTLSDPLPTALWSARAVAFVPGTHALLTAGDSYGVPTVELRPADALATPAATWQDPAASATIRALAWRADVSGVVAVGGGFGAGVLVSLTQSDLADMRPVPVVHADGHDPVGVALVAGAGLFVTAGSEGTLRFWDLNTVAALLTLDVPAPVSVAVDPAGVLITAAGADGVLRLYGCVD